MKGLLHPRKQAHMTTVCTHIYWYIQPLPMTCMIHGREGRTRFPNQRWLSNLNLQLKKCVTCPLSYVKYVSHICLNVTCNIAVLFYYEFMPVHLKWYPNINPILIVCSTGVWHMCFNLYTCASALPFNIRASVAIDVVVVVDGIISVNVGGCQC